MGTGAIYKPWLVYCSKRQWEHILVVCAANFVWIPSWPKIRATSTKLAIGLGPIWRYARTRSLDDDGDDSSEVCQACGWLTGNLAVRGPRCDFCGDDHEVCGQCVNVTQSSVRCTICTPRKQEPEVFHALYLVSAGCDKPLDGLMMEGNN